MWNLHMIEALGEYVLENRTIGKNVDPMTVALGRESLATTIKTVMLLSD